MVLHGVIPCSSEAVNGSPDPERLLLMSAATGSCLSYDMIYEETEVLKDTELDMLFYADHKYNIKKAARQYSQLKPLLSSVSDSFITDYQRNGNVIRTTFSNGTEVTADLDSMTVRWNGGYVSFDEQ